MVDIYMKPPCNPANVNAICKLRAAMPKRCSPAIWSCIKLRSLCWDDTASSTTRYVIWIKLDSYLKLTLPENNEKFVVSSGI